MATVARRAVIAKKRAEKEHEERKRIHSMQQVGVPALYRSLFSHVADRKKMDVLCPDCVAERFALIEGHWLYFLGYGGVLASLSIRLRFWDLFVVRTVLYCFYIANAPHACFRGRSCRPLPVFQLPRLLFDAFLQLAALRVTGKSE